MKKTFTLFISLLLATTSTWADNIPEDEARRIAEAFMGKESLARTGAGAVESHTLELAHTAETFYAFNRGEKDGFVIVANDDMVHTPVLGYADSGEFTTEGMPENMRWWLSVYEGEIASLKARKALAAPRIAPAAKILANIEPLTKTKWDQGAPYNNLCPTVGGQLCYTGCVATAMAQVMYHHRWPLRGKGSNAYDWYYQGAYQKRVSSTFSSHKYDYDAMALNYSDGKQYSDAEKKAVAQLMFDAGVSVNMGYGPNESGAYNTDVAQALYKYFNYDRSLIYANRYLYTTSEWEQMLHADLAANRPIYYGGGNKNYAHAFVIDGYQDGYFHVNWGWSGASNGYFLLTALDPTERGIGGGAEGYNSYQLAMLNLKRPVAGSTFTVSFYSREDFKVEKTADEGYYTHTNTAKFLTAIHNGTIATRSAAMGIKVISDSGKDTTYIEWMEGNVNMGVDGWHGTNSYTVSLRDFPREEGKYIVTPAARTSDGKWHDVKVYVNCRQHIVATVEDDRILFTYPEEYLADNILTTISLEGKAFAGKNKAISVSMENTGEEEYYGMLLLHILNDETQESVDYVVFSPQLYGKEHKEYSLSLPMPQNVGTYSLTVTTIEGVELSERASITVSNIPAQSAPPSLAEPLEVENANEVYLDDINLYATLTCKRGLFENYIGSCVYESDAISYVDGLIHYTHVTLCEGEKHRIKMPTGFSSALKEGKTYYATTFYYDGTTWHDIKYNGNRALVKFRVVGATGIVDLDSDATPNAHEDILVYNTSGILVLRQKGGVEVDLSPLQSGIYIIKQGKVTQRVLKK